MIKSAPFSFVRFEHPGDSDFSLDIPCPLPAFDHHEVAFRFIVDDDRAVGSSIKLGTATDTGTLITAFATTASIQSYKYRLAGLLTGGDFMLNYITIDSVTINYLITVDVTQFAQILEDDWGIDLIGDYFIKHETHTIEISATSSGSPTTFNGVQTAYWHQGYIKAPATSLGTLTCFTYALLNSDNTVLGYSNLFRVVDEAAFTSLLTYSCDDDEAFEFFYYSNTPNIIRLPMYLKQPQYPKKREVNKRSDGTTQLLTSQVEKEYLLETEDMPEVFHECLTIAFSHDNVTIENVNIREVTVNVIETENYAPQWDEYLTAKGKGKLKVATYGYNNSNC